MNEELKAKIEEVCADEEYMKYLLSLGSVEAMCEALEEKDIDLTPEQLRQVGTLLRKKESGELTDEELEQVAGGEIVSLILYLVAVAGTLGPIVWDISRRIC